MTQEEQPPCLSTHGGAGWAAGSYVWVTRDKRYIVCGDCQEAVEVDQAAIDRSGIRSMVMGAQRR